MDSENPPEDTTARYDAQDYFTDEKCSGGGRSGKLRLKTSKSKSRRHKRDGDDEYHHNRRHHRSHHHHHRNRDRDKEKDNGHASKRFKTSHTKDDDRPQPPGYHDDPLSAEDAFRESLFDALGDDEGADYWEGVYGQPIHTYPIPSVPKGPEGELEQMSDEEYATYVRARMWERTHEGIMEERERIRAERTRAKEQERRREEERKHRQERMRFDSAVEESLKRGRERRRAKSWISLWNEYRQSWEKLDQMVAEMTHAAHDARTDDNKSNGSEASRLRNVLFWPVESGKRKDVSSESVKEFIRHSPPPSSNDAGKGSSTLQILKSERVRWHPDKIQHRYGALGIDPVVMQSVTQVFQIIDQMWKDELGEQG